MYQSRGRLHRQSQEINNSVVSGKYELVWQKISDLNLVGVANLEDFKYSKVCSTEMLLE